MDGRVLVSSSDSGHRIEPRIHDSVLGDLRLGVVGAILRHAPSGLTGAHDLGDEIGAQWEAVLAARVLRIRDEGTAD